MNLDFVKENMTDGLLDIPRSTSTTLIENKNKPDMRLTELERQLGMAEIRCGSLKSQLDYMKTLYCTQPEREQFDRLSTVESHDDNLCKAERELELLDTEINDYNKITTSAETMYSNVYNKINQIQQGMDEEIEVIKNSPPRSPKMCDISTKVALYYNAIENSVVERDQHNESTVITPNVHEISQNTQVFSESMPLHGNVLSGNDSDGWRDKYSDKIESRSENYSLRHSARLDHNKENFHNSIKDVISEQQIQQFSQEQCQVEEEKLMRNTSQILYNEQFVNRKILTKNNRKQNMTAGKNTRKKTSACKVDESTSKVSRKRGKLKSSNSKSTIATRCTSITGRRDVRKRKQKCYGTNYEHSAILNSKPNCKELEEIYHNMAANCGSNSVVSSKPEHQRRPLKKTARFRNYQPSPQPKLYEKHNSQIYQSTTDKQSTSISENFHCNRKEDSCTNSHIPDYNVEGKIIHLDNMDKAMSNNSQNVISHTQCYNSMNIHNYEMPTLASKLKQANRSYFSRFSFRSIPFVVGTSVTPSHNLGLNIQQVLSIMKTRQPTMNGTSPLSPILIRKVSRGIKPVSTLIEQIRDHHDKSYADMYHEMENLSGQKESVGMNQAPAPKYNIVMKNNALEKNENKVLDRECENSNIVHSKSGQNMQELAGSSICITNNISMKKEDSGDKDVNPHLHNSKGIREVLLNLHDQFEEMNNKYETLQGQIEMCHDKNLEEQLSHLEKELNTKEEEINAVVSLYKEVMALKQQVKLLQGKKSFVCISTEFSNNSNKSHTIIPVTPKRAHTNNVQLNTNTRNYISNVREPSTAIRLAGLLRQIQTFQKQLALT
ncbi:hypothetical protein KM043_017977 [Ampulex compressa]|nr:hypothetical protein KM043_017977 [Ampulex compressa]